MVCAVPDSSVTEFVVGRFMSEEEEAAGASTGAPIPLDAVLQHLGQGFAHSGPHVADTSDTSADGSEASLSRRRVRSKRTYKMKKVWCADEIGRFSVTGATDELGKPSHFYCRICRKEV